MWDSLLPTVVGGAVAAGAGILTALINGRHATTMGLRQQEREDRYRLYRDRVDAYLAFRVAIGEARRVLQNFTDDAQRDGAERRTVRNRTSPSYMKIALIGSTAVVETARQMMIHIDNIAYGRAPFDSESWNVRIDAFCDAARYDLIGQHDLASIIATMAWPAPPPHPARPASTDRADELAR